VSNQEAALFLMPGDKILIEGLFADTFSIVLYGQSGTASPCACSPTGLNGGASVTFKGCANHPGQSWSSNNKPWCYVNGGVRCAKATPVAANPGAAAGAAWRYCSTGAEAALAASRDILFSFSPNPRRGTIARNDASATFPCTSPTRAPTELLTSTSVPTGAPTSSTLARNGRRLLAKVGAAELADGPVAVDALQINVNSNSGNSPFCTHARTRALTYHRSLAPSH
jgi:hypothetical protein